MDSDNRCSTLVYDDREDVTIDYMQVPRLGRSNQKIYQTASQVAPCVIGTL